MPAPFPDSTSVEGRSREEKALRRSILAALGPLPDVLVLVNEANVFTQLVNLMPAALKGKAYQAILPEERHGLGVGSPDLVVIVRGRLLLAELKTPTGTLSPGQRDWHEAARRKGAEVLIWRSVEDAMRDVERARHGW